MSCPKTWLAEDVANLKRELNKARPQAHTPLVVSRSTAKHKHLCVWSSSYPRSPNLRPEAVVDCVGKPWIFIQCSYLIAPPRGYESALWRTRMLLTNAGRKITDWLLRDLSQCTNLCILITWSIMASALVWGLWVNPQQSNKRCFGA